MLTKNPNSSDSRPCYVRPKPFTDEAKNFGKKHKGWKLTKRDRNKLLKKEVQDPKLNSAHYVNFIIIITQCLTHAKGKTNYRIIKMARVDICQFYIFTITMKQASKYHSNLFNQKR